MPPILQSIDSYLLSRKRVDPTHARAGAIFCLSALARNWTTLDGQPLSIPVALAGSLSAEPCLEGMRDLLEAVGVAGAAVDPYGTKPDPSIPPLLWFQSPKRVQRGDQREYNLLPCADLVATCRRLQASSGVIQWNPDVEPMLVYAASESAKDESASAVLKVASLLALGSERDGGFEFGAWVSRLDVLEASLMLKFNQCALFGGMDEFREQLLDGCSVLTSQIEELH